jgi:hypothetical protein
MESKSQNIHPGVQQIRFLSDQPLDADREREMRFGHMSIVENLKASVLSCPTPFTIGLFGKWGTGKTTILDALKRKFHATEIAVIKIDAWKHEGDALRRTFLQDTINQLQEKQGAKQYLGTDIKLSENLHVPISRAFRSGIKPNWSLIWPLLIILAVLVGVGFLIDARSPNNLGTYISTVTGGGLVATIILWLLQQSVTTETVTTTTERFEDPHEFEAEFKKIVNQTAAEKLLVIIDNLDRVSCDKAVELLSTIKTFLEQRKCVFLIACDADAIKKHLERRYAADSENIDAVSKIDGDEFLRKFFNSSLIIPEFIDTELHSYTENLLRETNLSVADLPDVAYVIAKAFRDNPRQIKQFINTLLSHFLLAESREASGELPKGSITQNVAYLAKDLIIRLRFPKYYDSVTHEETINTENNELNDFLRATRPVHIEDNRPFRYLKLSEEEIGVPEIRELQVAIQDNNVESAQKIIGGFLADTEKLTAFNKFILSFIDRNRGRGLLLSNIISSILSVSQKLGLTLDKNFYYQVAELFVDDGQLGTQLQNFSPNIIFNEVLGRCEKWQIDEIIQRCSGLFSNPDQIRRDDRESYIKDLLQEFIEHKNWLNATRKQEIRSAITQKYCRFEVLSMFIGKIDEQKEFIHEETLSKFIGEISESDVENPERLRAKVGLLVDFKGVVSDKNLAEIITRYTALISTEMPKPYRDEKNNLLACLDDVICSFDDKIAKLNTDVINPFVQQIIRGINALGPLVQKRIFIPVCLRLEGVINDPLKSQINSALNKFFAGASSDDLSFVFNKFKTKSDKEGLIIRYRDTFQQRVISDQNIFDFLCQLATKEIRTEWLTALIQTDPQRAIAKLEQLNYQTDDKKAVVSAILTKAGQIQPVEQRESLYIACNKMKCANDIELKEKLVSFIKIHLKDTNPVSQKIGLAVLQGANYLSQTQRRDITTETVEWLSTLQPNSAYQPSSAQSPLVTWTDLTPTLKQKFLDFVFDKLMRRGINSQSIDLGFNILGRIEPKPEYNEYAAYFDDILHRTETEPNPEIKSHLVKGLISLEPAKLNKENKEFWEKVRQLPAPEKP